MSSPPPQNPSNSGPATTADYVNPSVSRQGVNKQLHPANLRNPQPTTNTPPFPQPPPPSQRQQRPHQPPLGGGGVVYPVASSGRGFISRHHHDQNLIPNSVFPPYRPNGFSGQHSHQLYQNLVGGGSVMPTGVSPSAHQKGVERGRGVAKRLFIDLNERPVEDETVDANDQSKVAGQSSLADDKSLKNARDKNGDDTFVIIRDRKVQISEGTSLYAQCRSWLKNGYTLENQPQYEDCMKSLPKPLPASVVEPRTEDTEIEEKIEDVENMSAKELLQHHVRQAKKIRVRLRNQRLQRIERYKDRLALLLPPVVDQQPKNDPTS